MHNSERLFMLVFYVPLTVAEEVKQAVFAVGGGRLGDYDSCCWQTTGRGQFRPLEGSNPFIGEAGAIEYVDEARVEMVCSAATLEPVLRALIDAHPYETPAYAYWEVNREHI